MRKIFLSCAATLILCASTVNAELFPLIRLEGQNSQVIVRDGGDYYFYHKGELLAEGNSKPKTNGCALYLESLTANHRIVITGNMCGGTGRTVLFLFGKGVYVLTDSAKKPKGKS